ncbi:ABC transporter permease [Evansella sp. AB-rgal1]|uniref:ABC transporter permease n=1 Tax=Evansella sp. AB-rgal1 TaxID=3242696 RepID=UPI00359E82CF
MNYIGKRLVSAVFLILIVSFLSFVVLIFLPGDPVKLMLGTEAPPHVAEELSRQYGFDRPWYEQYGDWFFSFIQGDLGESFLYKQPVSEIIAKRLPMTLSLTLLSIIMAVIIAVPVGVFAAAKKGSLWDSLIQAFVQIGIAVPNFWVGIMFILLFAVMFPLFPPGGYVPLSEGLFAHLKTLFLPALTLALAEAVVLIRMIRASLLEVLEKDYMTFSLTKRIIR